MRKLREARWLNEANTAKLDAVNGIINQLEQKSGKKIVASRPQPRLVGPILDSIFDLPLGGGLRTSIFGS